MSTSGQSNVKVLLQKFWWAETVNIYHSKSFHVYGIFIVHLEKLLLYSIGYLSTHNHTIHERARDIKPNLLLLLHFLFAFCWLVACLCSIVLNAVLATCLALSFCFNTSLLYVQVFQTGDDMGDELFSLLSLEQMLYLTHYHWWIEYRPFTKYSL